MSAPSAVNRKGMRPVGFTRSVAFAVSRDITSGTSSSEPFRSSRTGAPGFADSTPDSSAMVAAAPVFASRSTRRPDSRLPMSSERASMSPSRLDRAVRLICSAPIVASMFCASPSFFSSFPMSTDSADSHSVLTGSARRSSATAPRNGTSATVAANDDGCIAPSRIRPSNAMSRGASGVPVTRFTRTVTSASPMSMPFGRIGIWSIGRPGVVFAGFGGEGGTSDCNSAMSISPISRRAFTTLREPSRTSAAPATSEVRPSRKLTSSTFQSFAVIDARPFSATSALLPAFNPSHRATSLVRCAVRSNATVGPDVSDGAARTPDRRARTLPDWIAKSSGVRSSSMTFSSVPPVRSARSGWPSSAPRRCPSSGFPAGSATLKRSSANSTGRPPSSLPYDSRLRSISSRTSRLFTSSAPWSPSAFSTSSKRPSRPFMPRAPASSSASPPRSESCVPSDSPKRGGSVVPSAVTSPFSGTSVIVASMGALSRPSRTFRCSRASRTSPGRLSHRATTSSRSTSAAFRPESENVAFASCRYVSRKLFGGSSSSSG